MKQMPQNNGVMGMDIQSLQAHIRSMGGAQSVSQQAQDYFTHGYPYLNYGQLTTPYNEYMQSNPFGYSQEAMRVLSF